MHKNENFGGKKQLYIRHADSNFVTWFNESCPDWKKISLQVNGLSELKLRVHIEASGTFWFDDICVREFDTVTGKCIGDNLYANGAFEENADKIQNVVITEDEEYAYASIDVYNAYGLDYYIATYNNDKRFLYAVRANANGDGDLIQTISGKVPFSSDVKTVKVFAWDGIKPICESVDKNY